MNRGTVADGVVMSRLFKEILFSVCCSAAAFAATAFYFWGQCINILMAVSIAAVALVAPIGPVLASPPMSGVRLVLGALTSLFCSGLLYLVGIFIADAYGLWILMLWPVVMIAAAIGGFRLGEILLKERSAYL